jgi:hypothetical protein
VHAISTNLIRTDGHIEGLDLNAGGLLVVREYHGPTWNPALIIPITIDQHLAMGSGGTLRMVFEADAWDSTISFAPGIPVTLDGTLELTFAADVNPATQLGRTFDLFDWTGVTPTGAFAISSPYAWDLSNLYTSGEVVLLAIPEPATHALVALGLLVLAVRGRRPRPTNNRSSKHDEESHAEAAEARRFSRRSYFSAISAPTTDQVIGAPRFKEYASKITKAIARQTAGERRAD